jgi:hypothetical protein
MYLHCSRVWRWNSLKTHPGIVSETEKEYVRNHLDEVNARLREQGKREIDPADPEVAERYGLQQEPVEAEIVAERPEA